MNRLSKHALVVALALASVLGSVLGTRALRQAMTRSQDLYRVDTAGSQIESDLEFEIQESRRAFLYALATTDPNEQLPYIDEAREASQRVLNALGRLRGLSAPELDSPLTDFERSWEDYRKVRNEIIAHVLEGDTAAALGVERMRGQPAFAGALRNLHVLKSTLESNARFDSAEVDQTLKRSAAGLAAFTLSTVLIVLLLSRVNRSRRLAVESLHASNLALAAAREMEEQRASVLEMVSTHAPLSRTLGMIVGFAPKWNARAGAAVWAAAGPRLQFQVAANLPKELKEAFAQTLPGTAEISRNAAELEASYSGLAREFGFAAIDCRSLRDAGGRSIGLLQVFCPDRNNAVGPAMLEQMAQLAAVAIENTLLHERLAFQAQHDTLTELPNRLLFQDRVQQALRLARRHRTRVAVLWIDLDRFKQINDTLGHRAGDELLCEVAGRLASSLRGSDTVARVGGDEFTVLANDINSPADAELVCGKILTALAQPMMLAGHSVAISASAGVSIFPEHGEDPMALMRHADLAMYSAKRAGGNSLRIFRPVLGDAMLLRLQIEGELKIALERNEFSLDYQPLMNRQGKLENLEALLRWNNPTLGRVSPADFIPIAEEMGQIQAIGEWVIRTACGTGARWLAAGKHVPSISVNVSAVQFVQNDFAATIERILTATQFPATKLTVEITETALMNNLDQALEQMASLRRLGVRFAIDDFGTGYSSLSQLRNLQVDCVKVDRSFVKDLDTAGRGSTTLVRGIIALAHSLGLEVVAEGIETEEHLTLLNTLGCDIYQGFFLHRPMPPGEVEKLLTAKRVVEKDAGVVTELTPVVAGG